MSEHLATIDGYAVYDDHVQNLTSCTCREPHVSTRIHHHYDGTPCHVIDPEYNCPASTGSGD